jgi:hypothetical protein
MLVNGKASRCTHWNRSESMYKADPEAIGPSFSKIVRTFLNTKTSLY